MCGTHNRKHTETFVPITNFMRWVVVVARVRITLAIAALAYILHRCASYRLWCLHAQKRACGRRVYRTWFEYDLAMPRISFFFSFFVCVQCMCRKSWARASFTKECAAAITHLSDKFYWIFDCGSLVLDQASIYDDDVHSIMTSHLV